MNGSLIAQIAIWIVIGLVILILIRLLNRWLYPTKIDETKDSEDFKEALEIWKPIVAGTESIETHRDVKTFANLARVICALYENKMKTKIMVPVPVSVLVGLTALVTIGELAMSQESYSKLKERDYKFRNPNLKEFQDQLDNDSWRQFLEIAKFVEFPETSSKI